MKELTARQRQFIDCIKYYAPAPVFISDKDDERVARALDKKGLISFRPDSIGNWYARVRA